MPIVGLLFSKLCYDCSCHVNDEIESCGKDEKEADNELSVLVEVMVDETVQRVMVYYSEIFKEHHQAEEYYGKSCLEVTECAG